MEPWHDESVLQREYWDKGRTTTDMADEWDITPQTLTYWFEKHDIPRRSSSESHAGNRDTPWRDESVLRELYVERGLSIRESARELECDPSVVNDWLGRHGIDKRPPGGPKGEKNGAWRNGGAPEGWYHNSRWKAIRDEAIDRDGGACFLCGVEWPNLDGHHVEPAADGGEMFSVANVLAVCVPCHARVFDGGGW